MSVKFLRSSLTFREQSACGKPSKAVSSSEKVPRDTCDDYSDSRKSEITKQCSGERNTSLKRSMSGAMALASIQEEATFSTHSSRSICLNNSNQGLTRGVSTAPPERKLQFSRSMKSEALMNIIDDEKSWKLIQQQLKESNMVTSIGIQQICGGVVEENTKKVLQQREMQKKRGPLARIRRWSSGKWNPSASI